MEIETKQPTATDKIEEAKLLIANKEKEEAEAAAKEYNDFVKEWSARTGYRLQIQSGLTIMKL